MAVVTSDEKPYNVIFTWGMSVLCGEQYNYLNNDSSKSLCLSEAKL